MSSHIIVFILGGYFLPALLFGWSVWQAESHAEDSPTLFERIVSTVIGGLTWPMASLHSVPQEEFDG